MLLYRCSSSCYVVAAVVVACSGRSGAVARASVSRLREPGLQFCAGVSNLRQVVSLHIAPVQSAVRMNIIIATVRGVFC